MRKQTLTASWLSSVSALSQKHEAKKGRTAPPSPSNSAPSNGASTATSPGGIHERRDPARSQCCSSRSSRREAPSSVHRDQAERWEHRRSRGQPLGDSLDDELSDASRSGAGLRGCSEGTGSMNRK